MTPQIKTSIVEQYRVHDSDTGSAEVQVAILTSRIVELTEHLKTHTKDHATRRGLLKLVGRRTNLLRYLAKEDKNRYKDLIGRLNLRK